MRPQVHEVILQPNSLCNLDCTYCYVPARLDAARMDDHTLACAIECVLGSDLVRDEVSFIWHAGEPLLAGVAFYERAAALIERFNTRGLRVRNAIQTNATRVTERWCELFAAHGFSVGVSIDGPAFLNDRQRMTRTGKGAHAATMRGVRLLQAHGIRVGALCVLTRESLRHPDEIYAFFCDNGFASVGFNVEEVENAHRRSSLAAGAGAGGETVAEFRRFAERLYELWRAAPARLPIRELDELACVFWHLRADDAFVREPYEAQAMAIVTIHKNGDISTFSPEFAGSRSARYGDFVIGNVRTDSLEDALRSPALRRIRADVEQGRRNCRAQCDYYALCGGAFQSNRFFENGSLLSTQTTTCRLIRQTLAEVVLEQLLAASGDRAGRRRADQSACGAAGPAAGVEAAVGRS